MVSLAGRRFASVKVDAGWRGRDETQRCLPDGLRFVHRPELGSHSSLEMSVTVDAEIVSCPSCGGANRVRRDRVREGLSPVCGLCRKGLCVDAGPVTVTDGSFAAEVLGFPRPVLVDLWAAWCAPCRMIAPALDEIAGDLMGRVRIAKLNVDENPNTHAALRVSGIPTLVMFRGGKEIDRVVGALPPPQLRSWIERFV
jgi:thioredoxin 2